MPFPTGEEDDQSTVHRGSAQLAEVDATRQKGGAVLTPREPPAPNAMVAIMSQGLLTVTLARGNLGHIATTETTVGTGLTIDVLKTASRKTTHSDRDHLLGPVRVSSATAWDTLSAIARASTGVYEMVTLMSTERTSSNIKTQTAIGRRRAQRVVR